MGKKFRVFATADIGESIELLRERDYEVEVYPKPEAPPKSLIIEKVGSGIDGLITTLRDPIDAEVFEAGKGTLKVVAQIAVGFDNINRTDANRYKVPFTHTADVLTEATAEFAFFLLGSVARKMWPAEHLTRENRWGYWHPYLPFVGDEVTGKTIAVIGTGRIGQALIKKCSGFDMIGWKISDDTDDDSPSGYVHIQNGEEFIGGIQPVHFRQPGTPAHWLPYLFTSNCDATAAKAKQLGAKFYMEPTTMENVGRFGVLADPQGATFAIFQSMPRK